MTIWFTSDLHLNHSNIIKFCNRPFDNVEEMNEALIDNFNDCVSKNDTVYILGDFCFNATLFEKYIKRLKGQKHFIIGNHDPKNVKNKLSKYFVSVSDIKQITIDKNKIILCHFPLREWNAKFHGSWHLHGHTHGKVHWRENNENCCDVGVDACEYKPISYDYLKDRIF
jgi:calcineurin-like phosphoesterase family protein